MSETRHDIGICVIDNATPDLSVHNVCRVDQPWADGIVYIRLPFNSWFSRACNTGIHVSGQADAFLFLNNDCFIEPDCIEKMVQAMLSGKGDIIGAKLLYPNGTIQHAGGMIDGNWKGVYHEHRGLAGDDPLVNKSRNVSWVTGACMLVRAKPFVEMQGFYEGFVNGYEDVDLCLRFIEKGRKVYYCAEAIGTHLEGQTPGRKDSETSNAKMFFQVWTKRDVNKFIPR
jgi:GT2 family glycosyltransferase